MKGIQIGVGSCRCESRPRETRLVAVTGGPGAGKTAVLEMALQAFCSHVGVLPEAAGVVFGGGFPRHGTDVGRRAAQRAIFHVQREIETIVLEERRVGVGLCDRGTVDGLAYWPGSPDCYWRETGSSLEEELRRYSAVIHLQTPAADQGYNHDNALRVETASEAQTLDRRILAAWEEHPKRLIIQSDDDFLRKASRALELVRGELSACCHGHPIPGEDPTAQLRSGTNEDISG